MKRKVLGLMLVFLSFLTISCGRNTKDWPRLYPDLSADNITRIDVSYYEKEKDKIISYEKKTCALKENIEKNIELFKWYPYENKIKTNKPSESWFERTIITILFNDESELEINHYCYGICDGLVSFKNNEYHFIPGYFKDVYEDFIVD